jgi:beta-galactosidase
VSAPGQLPDAYNTPFGIRTFTFDPNQGLFVNGQHIKVQGECNHQDFAGIGIGMPDNILSWRIAKLKAMGCNGYRMSHNPPAAELLDACDQQGMLVLDENRHLGDTYDPKTQLGTTFTDPTDLNAMIQRDRNHPSIFMWSICNEEYDIMGNALYQQLQTAMQNYANSADPTRPCTAAEFGWEGVTEVNGINYNIGIYDSQHTTYPNQPTISTEDASCTATRGEYATDDTNEYDTSYDDTPTYDVNTLEQAWPAIATRPFIEGGFGWTGFDYRGEPDPWGWPSSYPAWPTTNSGFGVMDLCGFPKDGYYYMQSVWLPSTTPVVHIFPHWTWPGKEGTAISVWAYTNGDNIELFLNGVSQGKQAVPPLGHVQWSVNYAAGSLVAIAYKNGARWGSQVIQTAGAAASMSMRSDVTQIRPNGEDISPVEVSILDAKGVLCPTANNNVVFSVTGPGRIVGVGNGNPSGLEPDYATQREAFNGRCMVLVRHTSGWGSIVVTAKATGLPSAFFTINVPNPTPGA